MIAREIFPYAQFCLKQFRALCIIGPRQSGKTTLSKMLLKKPYVNFENPSMQTQFESDPHAFVMKYKAGAIFDEVQRVPLLLRVLQEVLDNQSRRGQFIITGSQQLLMLDSTLQSLAGRVGYLSLLPLSYAELSAAGMEKKHVADYMLRGGYPEIWAEDIHAGVWLDSYIHSYVQRDVRTIKNIINLAAFNKLLTLCAQAAGQIVNRDEFSRQVGVDTKTIDSWIGVLEASFVVFLLRPWYTNSNKRIIKSPKLYFYDTGLLCRLLNVTARKALLDHSNYGAIFETWVIAEIMKNKFNRSDASTMYFLRDRTGNEIDLVYTRDGVDRGIEIKSSNKINPSMFRSIAFWQQVQRNDSGMLLYGGEANQEGWKGCAILPWRDVATL
ncbi:MAG: ATP-binding protein [Flavobacteriales bacterium]